MGDVVQGDLTIPGTAFLLGRNNGGHGETDFITCIMCYWIGD